VQNLNFCRGSLHRWIRWRYLPHVLIGLAVLFLSVRAMYKVVGINDFQVFHWSAIKAWRRVEHLYALDSIEQRQFLYPPPAAFLMIPLGWLPYLVAGFVFTLLRVLCLWGILLIGLRWAQKEGFRPDFQQSLWLCIGALFVCWRFLDNEFGNGQINTLVAFLCIGGVWWAFAGSGREFWGGGVLAVAVILKCTPAIFLVVFLFYRKWKALAGFAVFLFGITGLTYLWFGSELMQIYWVDWYEWMNDLGVSAGGKERIVSLPSFLHSLVGLAGVSLSSHRTRSLWLLEVFLVMVLYTGARFFWFRRGRSFSPLWDVTVLAILMPLLSPMTRRAHLVILLFPVLIVWMHLFPVLSRLGGRSRLFLVSFAVLFLGPAIPVQDMIPAYGANPLLCFGMCLLLLGVLSGPLGSACAPPP
jgi:hypothetical protein